MTRRARQPEPQKQFLDYAGLAADMAGAKIAQNPAVAGGSVAFSVVMFFVASNALFYQPFKHDDALFATRGMENYVAPVLPKAVSLRQPMPGVAEDNAAVAQNQNVRPRDVQLIDIQTALARLKLYDGTIDGVPGPKTRAAIQQFQQQAGLEPTGHIDPLLIDAIRTASIPAERIPAPHLRQTAIEPVQEATEPNGSQLSQSEVIKLQAGLKTFANDDMEVDGKIGTKTKTAIIEFQRLFQLEETGTPTRETLAKLQELGLVSG